MAKPTKSTKGKGGRGRAAVASRGQGAQKGGRARSAAAKMKKSGLKKAAKKTTEVPATS